MDILLIFFALPIAVIIFSVVLQKLLRCPFLVASIIFAIFLVVTFVVDDLTFLVATIVYTIIALITAFIVMIICKFLNDYRNCCCRNNNNNINNAIDVALANNENNDTNNISTITNIGTNGTRCTCRQVDNNTISVSANIVPSNNNTRTGRFYGSYRG